MAKKDRKIYDTSKAPEWLSPEAQAEWASTPEEAKQWILRRRVELTRGIEKYRPQAELMESLRPFDEYARSQGKSLAQLLLEYTSIESALHKDPVEGWAQMLRHYGYDPVAVGRELMAQLHAERAHV